MENFKQDVIVIVSESGVISPTFNLPNSSGETSCTSGFLKYFFTLTGKKVRVSIEVLEEDE